MVGSNKRITDQKVTGQGVVLGLNAYSHDASAVLFIDGKLVFAAEEERYVRIKHSEVFPRCAVDAALRHAGVGMSDIQQVAFCWRQDMAARSRFLYFLRGLPRTLPFLLESPVGLPGRVNYIRSVRLLEDTLKEVGIHAPVTFVDHHRAHAAQAYRLSNAPDADVLVADGMGEWETTSVWRAHDGKLTCEHREYFPQSLGKFYSAVTQWLGFRPHSGEGKTMGLAPYGNDDLLDAMRAVRIGKLDFARGCNVMAGSKFNAVFGPPRQPEDTITQHHKNVAWAAQRVLEEHVLARLPERKSKRLALAGGIFMNCVLNGRLGRESGYDEVSVFPAAGDAGAAAGAVAEALGLAPRAVTHAYWGDQYDGGSIGEHVDDPARAAAEALARGKIVGWFSGRMEFGPRALGARSILADPRLPGIRDRINRDVKFREDFRPFAPAVLREQAEEWFDGVWDSPFMLFTFPVRPERRVEVPGIVHTDGSARVQTVGPDDGHPQFRRVLEHFYELTGVPLLLNTSFNVRGEPIVQTPEQAVEVFRKSALDVLFVENRVLR